MSAVLLFSCNQIETFDAPDLSNGLERILFKFKSDDPNARMHKDMFTCNDVETILLAGQHIPVGKVHAYNDLDSLYINVTIEGEYEEDWVIRKLNLFVGQTKLEFEPVGNGKSKAKKGAIINPAPGKFPFPSDIDSENIIGVQEYYFALPIGGGDEKVGVKDFGEIDIAVHADVVRVEGIEFNDKGEAVSGTIAQTEGAWAEGERFNPEGLGNWSMFFSYTVTECEENNCNPNWTRSFTMAGQRNNDVDNDELEVDFQVNGKSGGRVGVVTVKRTGNESNYTFTATFVPDTGFSFNEISICVNDEEFKPVNETDVDLTPQVCSTLSGLNVVSVITNNSITVGPGTSGRSNYVTISAISSACD
ncbi:hypothetical protein [Cecembia rubra]|uniref:hypothetical protein n=1 Tax=Cecembia rubra TaxID=1485585 RepID=UPI0011B24D79|nr:hypothetical protein [Cecembia rubra]